MNYKMIAIDMDGTLLNSKHTVSDKNKNMLKVATEKGIQVVISTGRIFTSARYYAKLLGLITPIIACNGAYVCEYHKDNVLYDNNIDSYNAGKIIDILEQNDILYRFYDNDNFYLKKLERMDEKYIEWKTTCEELFKVKITSLEDVRAYVKEHKPKIYKFFVTEEDEQKLNNVKEQIMQIEGVDVVSSWKGSFDIMNKGVSKGKALEELCKIMNIKREEVIAIGDNFNDVSMIEFAGTGVAMGNGEDGVKAIADIVTESNDNDGVAKILRELIG
ncbi:Cof-type HAD-IIB family hydrolase [Clostridiaceae bacterium M8S5]|nr:Cof-type HAD-IIB family hydrolase [Clostridiaceae bacterium M8S5]